MSKVQVTGEDVISFLVLSLKNDTVPAAIDIAKEWIEGAEKEIYNLQEKVKRLERECKCGLLFRKHIGP